MDDDFTNMDDLIYVETIETDDSDDDLIEDDGGDDDGGRHPDGDDDEESSDAHHQQLVMSRRFHPSTSISISGPTTSVSSNYQQLMIQASRRKQMPPLQELYSMKVPSQVVGPAVKALETASASTSSASSPSCSGSGVGNSGKGVSLTPHTTITAIKPSIMPSSRAGHGHGHGQQQQHQRSSGPPPLRSVTTKPVDQLSVQMFGRRRKIMNIPKRKRLRNFRREDDMPGIMGYSSSVLPFSFSFFCLSFSRPFLFLSPFAEFEMSCDIFR